MFLGRLRACSNELKLGLQIPQNRYRREEFAQPTIYRNSADRVDSLGWAGILKFSTAHRPMISPAGGIPAARRIMLMDAEKSMRSFVDGGDGEKWGVKMSLGRLRACSNELKLGLQIPPNRYRREEFAPPTIYRHSADRVDSLG
ncbi:hypothetical protein CDAR_189291 [Caerostris darwini]|uniref:Uncharacterized protein n=1 Tax=Caerostris darwini TaxID=1538125 RepID=A0AAV4UGR1_9ARAC|nr:hypothetical protein CDAR_189291 [Caerostris darwini]